VHGGAAHSGAARQRQHYVRAACLVLPHCQAAAAAMLRSSSSAELDAIGDRWQPLVRLEVIVAGAIETPAARADDRPTWCNEMHRALGRSATCMRHALTFASQRQAATAACGDQRKQRSAGVRWLHVIYMVLHAAVIEYLSPKRCVAFI
jgi:hypothetical protein